MPYIITKGCEQKENFCIEACPFGCIEMRATSPRQQPRLSLDTELCTNCGACALVCPENVFVAAGPGYRKGLSVMPRVRRTTTTPKSQKVNVITVPLHMVMPPLTSTALPHQVHQADNHA